MTQGEFQRVMHAEEQDAARRMSFVAGFVAVAVGIFLLGALWVSLVLLGGFQ